MADYSVAFGWEGLASTTHKTRRSWSGQYQGWPTSAAIWAGLEETLDVLSSPEAMRQRADSQTAIEAGDVLDADEFAALVAKRSRQSR